jgi:hypothetical protein
MHNSLLQYFKITCQVNTFCENIKLAYTQFGSLQATQNVSWNYEEAEQGFQIGVIEICEEG